MVHSSSSKAASLIRELRQEAGLTQSELAGRIGTTQSVISRLESDAYEGHSLSMLYRIGAALNRSIVVSATGGAATTLSVRERAPSYEQAAAAERAADGLSAAELDRLAGRLARRFRGQGVAEADVWEAIRWARGDGSVRAVARLCGAIKVGPGNVADDVRGARARRGGETGRAT